MPRSWRACQVPQPCRVLAPRIEAGAGSQVEDLLVHRGCDRGRVPVRADDAAGEDVGVGVGIAIAGRPDAAVGQQEQGDLGVVDECGAPPLDLEDRPPSTPGARWARFASWVRGSACSSSYLQSGAGDEDLAGSSFLAARRPDLPPGGGVGQRGIRGLRGVHERAETAAASRGRRGSPPIRPRSPPHDGPSRRRDRCRSRGSPRGPPPAGCRSRRRAPGATARCAAACRRCGGSTRRTCRWCARESRRPSPRRAARHGAGSPRRCRPRTGSSPARWR